MRRPINRDLVLSMTLAEVFLLLLFVAWYGVSAVSAGPGSIAELQRENTRLNDELAHANSQLASVHKLELRVRFYQEILSALAVHLKKPKEPTSVVELEEWLKQHDENTKRG